MHERFVTKLRLCKHCGDQLLTDAEGMKVHALICSFEKRTGLTVVRGSEGFTLTKVL